MMPMHSKLVFNTPFSHSRHVDRIGITVCSRKVPSASVTVISSLASVSMDIGTGVPCRYSLAQMAKGAAGCIAKNERGQRHGKLAA